MPLISATGGEGCGVRHVAEAVADNLHYELYDDDRLQQEAISMGYSSEDLKAFDVKTPGLFDRLLRRRVEMYDELMAAVIYAVACRGEGIILGHGAFFFLKDFDCALHLRLHACSSFRVERVVDQKSVEPEAARALIENRDREMKGFLDFLFQIDWNDLSLYDLVINVDKMGFGAASEMVIRLAQADHIRECSLNAMDAMAKLSLQKRVEVAAMKENLNPNELHFEVTEPGVVKISGIIHPLRSASSIIDIVKSVSGVDRVICAAEKHPSVKM